jgi:DUF3040 family protein
MVPLSEEEQRLLEQMEEALAAEDPKFVSTIRGSSARTKHKRIAILATVGFVLGVVVLMAGAVTTLSLVAVGGFVIMLTCAYLAITHWRRIGDPDLPSNVHPIGKTKGRQSTQSSGFMNRMEDRWRRRRDDY